MASCVPVLASGCRARADRLGRGVDRGELGCLDRICGSGLAQGEAAVPATPTGSVRPALPNLVVGRHLGVLLTEYRAHRVGKAARNGLGARP